jgi:hypothetical protein
MNPVLLVLQQSAFDEHVAVVIHGYAQQYSVVDVELRRSAIPVQHSYPWDAWTFVGRQQRGLVVSGFEPFGST